MKELVFDLECVKETFMEAKKSFIDACHLLVSVFETFHQWSNMLLQSGLKVPKSNFVMLVSLQVKFGH